MSVAAAHKPVTGAAATISPAELLTRAERKENAGDFGAALKDYEEGLSILVAQMKSEPQAEKKDSLRSVISAYMSRAEALKKTIKAHKSGGAVGSGAGAGSARQVDASTPMFLRAKSAGQRAESKRAGAGVGSNEESKVAKDKDETKDASGIEPKLRAQIEGEILDGDTRVSFADVAGLANVKKALDEAVIQPALRPDVFTGLRAPVKGLLLFGPPGNGKTFIAKAVASEAKCTFFSISASSLVSKMFGEGEKLMRALFAIARERAPSIIFIDEIDSLLSKRSADEHDASRRLKTEFLVQLDGVASDVDPSKHVLVMGATNLPDQLDDAVLRRMPKRLFVPNPDIDTRRALIGNLMKKTKSSLSSRDMDALMAATDGYSASDLTAVCKDAAMGPVRELTAAGTLASTPLEQIKPVTLAHFQQALRVVKPSVTADRLKQYTQFEKDAERKA